MVKLEHRVLRSEDVQTLLFEIVTEKQKRTFIEAGNSVQLFFKKVLGDFVVTSLCNEKALELFFGSSPGFKNNR